MTKLIVNQKYNFEFCIIGEVYMIKENVTYDGKRRGLHWFTESDGSECAVSDPKKYMRNLKKVSN